MKSILTAALTLIAGPAFADWTQIPNRQTFNTEVVGNSYVDANGVWFRFNADRSLTGGVGDQALAGTWYFRGGMACFDRTLGGQEIPSDCIVVYVDGNQLVTVRDRGRGRQAQYTRQ